MKSPKFEVKINNQKIAVAGIENEFGVLTATVLWVRRKYNGSEGLRLDVRGVDSHDNESLVWHSEELSVGDEIKIKISDDVDISIPKSRNRQGTDEDVLQDKLKAFYRLKEELKEHL